MEGCSLNITLRPFKISDVDDFMAYAGDDKVTRFTLWNTFTSKDKASSFIMESCIPETYCRSICLDDRSIGYFILHLNSGDHRCRGDFGYALAAKYWGQGIATRALKMAMVEVFKDFPFLLRLQGFVEEENKASQRVLEKLGFFKEGVMRKYMFNKGDVRDIVVFSLLSTDLTLR